MTISEMYFLYTRHWQ